MAFREHSGTVVICCSDWVYTRDTDPRRAGEPQEAVESRVHGLVRFARQHRVNVNGIDPHIVRVEGPVEIISKPTMMGGLLTINPHVIGKKAWLIVADIHSDCAGFAGAHPEHVGDQFEAQAEAVKKNAQRFIDNVAVQIGHPMELVVFWTRFGDKKTVLETMQLCDVTSQVEFEDDSWRVDAPAGLFEDAMAHSR